MSSSKLPLLTSQINNSIHRFGSFQLVLKFPKIAFIFFLCFSIFTVFFTKLLHEKIKKNVSLAQFPGKCFALQDNTINLGGCL